ncbi:DUF397 domain-containing protein [Micromonospora matsumotoense]|uniref:DUF397 domain-containing protein n=1 Tax=Micromonospora matsumotoense TaxID=121616 RepID=UPI0033FF502A
MPKLSGVAWRKSTRSGSNADCVEVAEVAQVIGVRDSKDPAGPVLAFDRRSWAVFVAALPALSES